MEVTGLGHGSSGSPIDPVQKTRYKMAQLFFFQRLSSSSLAGTRAAAAAAFITTTISKRTAPTSPLRFNLTANSSSRRRRMTSSANKIRSLLEVGTKIIAVGRNYAAHAKELGNAVPKEPVLFMKPTSSYLANGGTIEIPYSLESLDHEVELAIVISQKARDVPEANAMDFIGGYALALDMTAREIQASAKSAGLPWTVAKGQDTFTPISSVLPKSSVPDPDNLELWLKVDGEIRQRGTTKDMIFKLPFLISHISSMMTLFEGDVILTGTPKGVGPVKAGQKITAGITDLIDVHFNIEKRRRPIS